MVTPFMNLELPTVTETPGPEWASMLNVALESIDSHDHTNGNGAFITSAALNINDSVDFNDNNIVDLKSARFTNQESELDGVNDVRCIYVSGNNLYYNNEAGIPVQITSGGGLNAASIGGIGGDYGTSDASLNYVNDNKTFVFNQSSNTRANIDIASLTIREDVSNAYGITIKSPNSLGASYDLTLPSSLPELGTNKFLTVDSTGQISAAYRTDDSTIEVSSNLIQIKDEGVTFEKLAKRSIENATNFNPPIGSFVYKILDPQFVINSEDTLSSTFISYNGSGGPVFVKLTNMNDDVPAFTIKALSSGYAEGAINIYRENNIGQIVRIASFRFGTNLNVDETISIPVNLEFIDVFAEGYRIYHAKIYSPSMAVKTSTGHLLFSVYELRG